VIVVERCGGGGSVDGCSSGEKPPLQPPTLPQQ